MEQGAVPGFVPSTNGFHFTNSFPHEPILGVNVPPLGQISIGDAAGGLCGGMAFAARDIFEAGLFPGLAQEPPASGTPEFKYLVRRLIDSFNLPAGPLRYLELMAPVLPDDPGPLWDVGVRGRPGVMIDEAWPEIRADIDGSKLSPLGLIRVLSADPRQLGENHQVLAYRYALDGKRLSIGVYDPNHPDDDTVELTLDVSNPRGATPVAYSAGDAPVYCFIRSAYTAATPDPWVPPSVPRQVERI